ncbi:MAG TPA: flagellar filament capping protein FliD [Acidimicrobiales bacterium]|nr:flagellar filament capping protein FliD [Acidimicrobiales bacterium]
MSVSSSGSSTSSTGATEQQFGYLNTAQTLQQLLGSTDSSLTSLENQQPTSISGLSSGIDTSQIVAELMEEAAQPQIELQNQLNSASTVLTNYQTLNTDVSTLLSVADTLESPSGWQAWIPSSSTGDATATAGAGATGGSITFSVDALAQADTMISAGSVGSTSAQVTSGPLLVAVGGGGLGISTLSSSNLSIGNHTIAVTQASSGATLTGSSAPATSTTINSSNDTLDYTLDGNTQSITIASGTYNASQLAAAVAAASGGQLTASVNSSGDMVISTATQGSSQTLEITGGTASSALGFGTVPTAQATGSDGIVTVDGVTNDLNDFSPGQAVTLNGPGGATVSATFSGPLTVGSLTAAEVNTGNGSLQSVVQAINASGIGITASAVATGQNQYNLSLQSNAAGAANTINVAPGSFSGLGSLTTVTAAQNAEVTVGTGPGAFEVTNDSNSITGLMPGVTLHLQNADPGTETTISLQPDGTTMASTVQSLVTAANQLITDLNKATAFTPASGSTSASAGPLLGDPTASDLLNSVLSAVSGAVGVNSSGSLAALGITMNSDGTLSFNSATFASAYDANPTQVANTFISGGSSSSPLMSFYESSDSTAPGNYQVDVTKAATQATDTGASLPGGTVSTAETLSIGAAGASASYTTSSGESLTAIAAGLNQQLSANDVPVNATVVDNQLVLNSMAYGSSSSFSVTSTASGAGTTGLVQNAGSADFQGTDVQGTIDGNAATGNGQLLLGAAGSAAQGLLVLVNATPSQVGTAGGQVTGTVDYNPGLAQALAQIAYSAGNPDNGTLTNAIAGQQSQMSSLTTAINAWTPILQAQQTQLQTEYDNMETSLASLKSTQSYLSQLAAEEENQGSSSSSGA